VVVEAARVAGAGFLAYSTHADESV
jgi:hypothetical protein